MDSNFYGFNKFCEIYDNTNLLEYYSATRVSAILEMCIREIKTEIQKELLEVDTDKIDIFLNLKINEISKRDYIKDYGSENIQDFLNKFKITVDDLFNNNYNSDVVDIIDVHLSKSSGFIEDYSYKHSIQNNLVNFFLSFYANELIQYFESIKVKPNKNKKLKVQNKNTNSQEFVNLDTYSTLLYLYTELVNINLKIKEESKYLEDVFDLIDVENKYKDDINAIKSQIPQLIDLLYAQSIKENIYYFDCSVEVYKNHFENRKNDFFKEVPDANQLDFLKSEIKYFSNPFSNRKINGVYDYSEFIPNVDRYKISLLRKLEFLAPKLKKYNYKISYREDSFLEDPFENPEAIGTLVKLEKTKDSLPKETETLENENATSKQLSANQAVLLLDSLDFFNLDKIKNTSKEKQSKLISQLIGRNHKNIKGYIQNLEKKPSQLGPNYNKDIDKINDILNSLE